jgi:hypothetical protein
LVTLSTKRKLVTTKITLLHTEERAKKKIPESEERKQGTTNVH